MKKLLLVFSIAMSLFSCSCSQSINISGSWHIDDAYGISTEKGENEAVITFQSNKVNGNTSINSFMGSYNLTDNDLTISNLGMTKMLGPNIEIEDAVVKGLNSVKKCMVENDKATLFDEEGKEIMHLTKK
ncbi:MAG: META domain-containing protein [Bacteroidales bacterium]|nr:META domain-containing protein [Bacteroidales bacterium]